MEWGRNGARAISSLGWAVGSTVTCGSEVCLSGCPPKAQASDGASEGCAVDSASASVPAEESLLDGALGHALRLCQPVCITKNLFLPSVRSVFSGGCLLQTALISSCGRKVVVSRRVTSCHSSQHCSSATQPVLCWVPVLISFESLNKYNRSFLIETLQ